MSYAGVLQDSSDKLAKLGRYQVNGPARLANRHHAFSDDTRSVSDAGAAFNQANQPYKLSTPS